MGGRTTGSCTRDLVPGQNTFVTTRLALGATGYGWSDATKPLRHGLRRHLGLPSVKGQLPAGRHHGYEYFTPARPWTGTEHQFVQNSGWAFVVPKTSKNQKAAWDLSRRSRYRPSHAQVGRHHGRPAGPEGQRHRRSGRGRPDADQGAAAAREGQWVGYIPAGAIETVEGALVSNFFAAVKGTKTVDQALADMQSAANEALAAAQLTCGRLL